MTTRLTKPTIWCRNTKCGYVLDGLPEHRCPECGCLFDPADANTFLSTPPASRLQRPAHPSLVLLLTGILVGAVVWSPIVGFLMLALALAV